MTRGRRGVALPATLLLLAVVAAVSLGLTDVARTQALLARNRLDAARAGAAADACLAQVVTAMAAGWEFDPVLAGPDGLGGTTDDGLLVAPDGCTAAGARAPGATSPPRMVVGIDAAASDGRRRTEAVIGRAPRPGVPALVWLAAGAVPGPVAGTLVLDGHDLDDPARPPLAALGAPGDPAVLDAWLAAEAGHVVADAAAPPRRVPDLPLSALLGLAAGGVPAAATLVAAGPPPEALTTAPGDLLVTGTAQGAGLLVVGGSLDIQGTFHFNGVVVVGGGLRVGSGGACTVDGALWLGAPVVGPALVVDGLARVTARAAAVGAADALLPLPRPGIVLGMRDGP